MSDTFESLMLTAFAYADLEQASRELTAHDTAATPLMLRADNTLRVTRNAVPQDTVTGDAWPPSEHGYPDDTARYDVLKVYLTLSGVIRS
jgi:hypothetical protein